MFRSVSLFLAWSGVMVYGHDLGGGGGFAHDDGSVRARELLFVQAPSGLPNGGGVVPQRPVQAAVFAAFAPGVRLRWDARFLFVESNGLPTHKMMVGITAWQQQVPLPQQYTGGNAWQIPLVPVPAKEPASIKNRFLRGAIALAANGIPIFNPQNNRGEISAEIGELDQWGGHCGRADDYHYHAAPLHLQAVLGKDRPIAYALDGYAIFGLAEPDGSVPVGLDAFHGHSTALLGYHYHASTKYPYVNGGFHGEVTERDGQVEPQPRAQPVRESLKPLRGVKITAFEGTGANSSKLSYEVNGEKRAVLYEAKADGTFPFEFQNGEEGMTREIYHLRQKGGGGGGEGPEGSGSPILQGTGGDRPARPKVSGGLETAAALGVDAMKKPTVGFVLTSPEVKDGGVLPVEYTGDGRGATLPLGWSGAPVGTKGYALIMDHLAPGNVMKHYWILWDIPGTTTTLAKNVQGVGKVGASFKGQIGYEPPHSQGPGAKTYVVTIYALSMPLEIAQQASEVNRDVLLAAMKGKVLASSSLRVVYSRGGGTSGEGLGPPPREEVVGQSPPSPTEGQKPPVPFLERKSGLEGGKGGASGKGERLDERGSSSPASPIR